MEQRVDVVSLQRKLRQFAEERDWQQFHSPKNLSMALAAEAGELLEVFQWLTEEQSRHLAETQQDLQRAREELADVVIYALRLADILGVDLEAAVIAKLARNAERYPVELARGNAVKYDRRSD
jgi:dCTP diphosphatase